MPEKTAFTFPSLDFPGRMTLRLDEIATRLGVTAQHVTDLIDEGKLSALDLRGEGATRAAYRVPVEAYRDWIVRCLTTPTDRLRLLRELPRASLVHLESELREFLHPKN